MGRDRLRAIDDEYGMGMAEKRAKVQAVPGLTDEELDTVPGLKV